MRQKIKNLLPYVLFILLTLTIFGGVYLISKQTAELVVLSNKTGIYKLGTVTTTCNFPANDCFYSDNDIINAGDFNNLFAYLGKSGTTSASTVTYQLTNTNANNIAYTGRLTITNASTTNNTITNLWVTTFNPTNSSTTNATLTNFWSTNGQVTNASTTYLTAPDSWITKLRNLTSNGFVKTGSGDGTLSVDTSTYLTTVDISANTNLTGGVG